MNFDINVEETRQPLPPSVVRTRSEKFARRRMPGMTRIPSVATAYSMHSQWRNRDTFLKGRQQIVSFLTGKWQRKRLPFDQRAVGAFG